MQRTVSFHPIDPEFFDGLIQPLVAGRKVNPEMFLEIALPLRRTIWHAARYKAALRLLLEQIEPPPPPAEGTMWEKVRARLERFDHRPEPVVRLVAANIEPDLHLDGRPFLITEGSSDRVGSVADDYLEARNDRDVEELLQQQLTRVDPLLAREVQPEDFGDPSADAHYRRDLLDLLKQLHDLANAARQDDTWGSPRGGREPAREVLGRELAWRAVLLHSRAVPFWIGKDVDGLDAVSRAAGFDSPSFLAPAWPLFSEVVDEFPVLKASLGIDLRDDQSIGAYVPPDDVEDLIQFLNASGASIIRVATRQGEGDTCKTLLRKIRECAHYAQRHGAGFLEATGIAPPSPENEE